MNETTDAKIIRKAIQTTGCPDGWRLINGSAVHNDSGLDDYTVKSLRPGAIIRRGEFIGCTVGGKAIFCGGKFDGCVITGGSFCGGEFSMAKIRGGSFNSGVFLGGVYYGGVFNGGTFHNGVFNDGAYYGGVFRGGTFHSGTYNGGDFRRGTFYEGTFNCGLFKSSPLFISLSKYPIAFVGFDDQCGWPMLQSGCMRYSLAFWTEEKVKWAARLSDYTEDQVSEYVRAFRFAADWTNREADKFRPIAGEQ